MAFYSGRFPAVFRCCYKFRYHSPHIPLPIIQSCPVSTQSSSSVNNDPPLNRIEVQSNLDEAHVLDQLSEFLPIYRYRAQPQLSDKQCRPDGQVETKASAVDRFLSPEEKLGGVFLQKLKGKSAIERALTDVGVDLSLDVVAKVLNRGSLGGESMLTFFKWAIKQPAIRNDIGTYNLVIRALGRRKFIDFVIGVLQELKRVSVTPNLETFSLVVDSLVRARRVKKAIQMFENMEEFGFERDTECLNVLLQCLCKRSHVGAALSYFNAVRGKVEFDNTTYNVIVGGWSKLGNVCEMERVLEGMVEDGFIPDSTTFSFVIGGLGRAGRMEDAVKVFWKMKEDGCLPDTNVYNAMISNLISVRDFDECLKYFRSMLSDDCHPNIDTYSKLISGFIKARRVADALEMFDEMLGQGVMPTTGTITSFIELLCGFGPPDAALTIYKKAREIGCQISLTSYKLLLMRLSRFGKCGKLLRIWDDMHESGYTSDTEVYEFVINCLCNTGQLDNAVLVMEESLRKGFCPSRLICSKLNNKLLAADKVERAYKLFLKIKDARRIDNARRFWRANGWHF